MVHNVFSSNITDDEKIRIYRQILKIFLSCGDNTEDVKDKDKSKQQN